MLKHFKTEGLTHDQFFVLIEELKGNGEFTPSALVEDLLKTHHEGFKKWSYARQTGSGKIYMSNFTIKSEEITLGDLCTVATRNLTAKIDAIKINAIVCGTSATVKGGNIYLTDSSLLGVTRLENCIIHVKKGAVMKGCVLSACVLIGCDETIAMITDSGENVFLDGAGEVTSYNQVSD